MFTFNNTPTTTRLTHHGSFGGTVEAFCDTCNEAVCFVNFARSGTDFIIVKFGIHPRITTKEAHIAGDLIDTELAKEAARLGVTKLFLVHPNDTVELLRTYEPRMPQLTTLPVIASVAYVN